MGNDYDLIKTIDDDQEVPDFSDKSDEEEDVSIYITSKFCFLF